MSNQVKFAFVFLAVNLHLVRNVSVWLFLAFYVPIVLVVLVEFIVRVRQGGMFGSTKFFLPWICFGILAFFVSLFLISPVGAFTGVTRFLFAAPIFIALVLYTEDVADLRLHISTFVYFFMVASLSLPLQFITGPVSWFAEASQRAGLDRYSSLIGSLTSIGVVVGSYLVLISAASSKIKWILMSATILPALVSLNKSALVNIAIALLCLVFLNRRSLSRIFVVGSFASALALAAYSVVPVLQERVDASLQSFGIDTSSTTLIRDDVSVQMSALDRLVTLPLANFQGLEALHSPLVYLVGGGYGMASTALVPLGDSLAPMAHNQFAEIVTVFGFVGGSILTVILFRILFGLVRRSRGYGRDVFGPLTVAYLIFLLNSVFANGTLYQPASASFFYLAMFAASSTLVIREQIVPAQTSVHDTS